MIPGLFSYRPGAKPGKKRPAEPEKSVIPKHVNKSTKHTETKENDPKPGANFINR